MSAAHSCPKCGARPAASAPQGLCPRCLLEAASSATATYHPEPPSRLAPPPRAPEGLVDVDEFRRAVLELGLIEADEFEDHAAEAAGDVARLARALVRAGRLTAYQAAVLTQGKTKGLVIGPYLVLEKRGQGGMGVVFRARHRTSGRIVALKILLPSFGRDREAVLRFRREFEVAARLDHPNVVSALEADEDRGVQFLTMEYVEGNNLDDLVQAMGALPIKLSLHCAIQAARGLAAAHALGIVHRDVKPGNLMLDATGQVRVLDLGLARVIEATNPMSRDVAGSLTRTGSYMGTVDYIAPEQADDSKRADHKADIYSLGCTLYFLLSGRPPFDGESILKRLMAHQQQPAPSLHAARGDVPAALEAAYQTMMAKQPSDRPRSMGEVIELLESCRTSRGEAKEAKAGLRSFAETALKRAGPKKRGWGVDASIFARPKESDGLQFDPDLKLEDLVADFRHEVATNPLAEDQLPPLLPRIAAPRQRSRRPPASRPVQGLVIAAVLLAASFAFFPRSEPEPAPKATALVSPKPQPEPRFAESIGIKIVAIPPGEFLMGLSPERMELTLKRQTGLKQKELETEQPSHRVKLTKLGGLSAHEITVGQFRRFVDDTGHKTASERNGRGGVAIEIATWKFNGNVGIGWRTPGFNPSDEHAVTCVDWESATEFCRWLSRKDGRTFRLPTEAEWEYCCRAGTDTLFANGDDPEALVRIGNVGDAEAKARMPFLSTVAARDGYALTAPVGRFAPNAWGIYDMHGNAWEWCQDVYEESYYGKSPPIDPPGPSSGPKRVARGGSWYDTAMAFRSTARSGLSPDTVISNVGFRVALDASGP